jgi:hypothetical protein
VAVEGDQLLVVGQQGVAVMLTGPLISPAD